MVVGMQGCTLLALGDDDGRVDDLVELAQVKKQKPPNIGEVGSALWRRILDLPKVGGVL